MTLLLPLLFVAAAADDPLTRLADLESVPANLALQNYEGALEEARLELAEALDPARASWSEAEATHGAALSAARANLLAELEAALADAAKRADVEENLRIERACQAIESGEEVPVPREAGRPGRGSQPFADHHYLVITDRKTWYEAAAHCRELGGALAVLETEEERAFVAGLVDDWTWLDLSDAKREGEWRWGNDAELAIDWEEGQPDNYGRWEHKGVIGRSGYLGDAHAEDRWPYLCEWGEPTPAAWAFTFRAARKAKERYDRLVRDADEAWVKDRAGIERKLAKPTKAWTKAIDEARDDLLEALTDAEEQEVRKGRSSVALAIREARLAAQAGVGRPPTPSLETSEPPEDAVVIGSSAFLWIDRAVPWPEAQAQCEAMGGRLAVAADPAVAAHIHGLAGRHGPLWLGASDQPKEGDWRWLDGRPVTGGWLPAQPNNHNDWEDYLVTDQNGFNDDHGEIRFGFVCEWEL